MALVNTTIFSKDDDDATALQQYSDLIKSENILMVILGDSESLFKKGEGEELDTGVVWLAGQLTGASPNGFKRWVLWMKDHIVLKDKLEAILDASGHIKADTPYEEIKAFCLTKTTRKAVSRVHKNSVLDPITILELYLEAESESPEETNPQ
jgi:hypothetical protein